MFKWNKKYFYVIIPAVLLLLLFVFIINIRDNSSGVLEILLKKKYVVSNNNFPESLLTNNLHTSVKVSNKQQEIRIYIQMSEFAFYLTQITDENKEKFSSVNEKFYSLYESNTYKKREEYKKFNFVPFFHGIISNENFAFGKLKLDNLKFILTDSPFEAISGGLGLNLQEYFGDGAEVLLNLMKEG